ncbi:MAG: hypothetical protein IKX53_02100 [Bacteroidales bacterium]|nr:hypothetical protein [Bacteroidales bacterium]
MKRVIYLFLIFLCAGSLLVSCKKTNTDNGAATETATETVTVDDSTLARVPAHNNTAEEDALIMDFIKEMYENSLFVENEFLESHCTPNLLQQLKDDYDYEGEGYANWDFRSDSQDGFGEQTGILKIEKINGRYYYEALDGGVKFRNILSAFVQDGQVLFDGIMRDESYNPAD